MRYRARGPSLPAQLGEVSVERSRVGPGPKLFERWALSFSPLFSSSQFFSVQTLSLYTCYTTVTLCYMQFRICTYTDAVRNSRVWVRTGAALAGPPGCSPASCGHHFVSFLPALVRTGVSLSCTPVSDAIHGATCICGTNIHK